MSVANIKIDKSGSAIRAVLADIAPDECAESWRDRDPVA